MSFKKRFKEDSKKMKPIGFEKIKEIDLSQINKDLDELSNLFDIINSNKLLLKKYNINLIIETKSKCLKNF